ncbi:hypothetical protein F4860DRAFT_512525 [Xylaria cubensis]|nr:hypothetical protein F4860DRAFT_512525 [Xylaria cubensis]
MFSRKKNNRSKPEEPKGAALVVTPQVIKASWIDGAKLRNLLDKRFGSEYTLETRDDIYYVYANGRLSHDDIMDCTYPEVSRYSEERPMAVWG